MSQSNHKYDWDGYAMVAAVRSQGWLPGQKSGLLTASETNADEYVQSPDETPRQFWKRVLDAVGNTCKHCGAKLEDVRQ